jgi:hypothetical protein
VFDEVKIMSKVPGLDVGGKCNLFHFRLGSICEIKIMNWKGNTFEPKGLPMKIE